MGKLQRKIQKYSVPTMWAAGVQTLLGLVFSKLSGWEVPATAAYLLAMVLAGGCRFCSGRCSSCPGALVIGAPIVNVAGIGRGPRKGCF